MSCLFVILWHAVSLGVELCQLAGRPQVSPLDLLLISLCLNADRRLIDLSGNGTCGPGARLGLGTRRAAQQQPTQQRDENHYWFDAHHLLPNSPRVAAARAIPGPLQDLSSTRRPGILLDGPEGRKHR